METLSLVVNIDLERLVSVRKEIERIKKELQTLNANTTPPEVFQALEKELAKNTKEFRAFVVAVTQAGLELDNSFKKKLYDSSQSVDNLTDKIKAQESVIRDSEEEVRRLSEAYAEHGKQNTNGDQTVAELNAAKMALEEQKNTLIGLRQEQAESSSSVKQLNNEYSLFRQLTGGTAMSGQELFTAIQGIPGPVGQAASSLKMLTKESLAFIATPLGATLAIISGILAALNVWFNRTEEGQSALNTASAYFNQTLEGVMVVVSDVGEWLWKAFTKPKDALNDLVDFLKGQVTNRINALGKMGASVMKIFSGDFSGGLIDLANAFSQASTGIEDAGEKYLGFLKGVDANAKKAAELAQRQSALDAKKTAFLLEQVKLEAQINKLKDEASDENVSGEKRAKSIKEALALTKKLHAEELALAKEKYQIIKGTDRLSGQKTSEKATQAFAELEKLKAQQQATQRDLQKQSDKLNRDSVIYQAQQEQADYLLQLSRNAKERENAQRQMAFDIKQAEIDGTKEGFKKEQAQIALNHEKNILGIEQRGQEMLKAQQDAERKQWEADGAEGVFTPKITTIAQLPAEGQKLLSNLTSAAVAQNEAENQRLIGTLLSQYQTYADKRTKIEAKFKTDLETMQGENAQAEKEGRAPVFSSGQIAEAEKQRIVALSDLDDEATKTTSVMSRLFGDMSQKTVEDIILIADEAESMWKFVNDGKYQSDNAFGLSQEQFEKLRLTPEEMDKIKKAIVGLRGQAEQSDLGFKKMADGLKDVFEAGNDFDKLSRGLAKIDSALQATTALGNMLADSFSAIGELSGNDTFAGIAEGLSNVLDIANKTMEGAQAGASVGGAAGAAVGAAIGMVTSIVGVLAKNKQHREELKKIIADNQEQEYFGDLEINQLYRERYEWAKKIGESTLINIQRQGEELKKQTEANAKEQDSLWSKLASTGYKSGEHFEKTGLFGLGKGKIVEEWASLGAKSWEEIERLASQGKLSEEGMKYYEALRNAKEEGNDLATRQEEYLESARELFTGSTYDGVVDGIVEGFKAGKRSAADFADSFDSLMQNAVVSALKMMADDKMRKWYENWAKMGEDGYTKDEITQAKKEYLNAIEELAKDTESLEEVTGVRFDSAEKEGASGQLQASMTEGTASQLVGLWNSTAIDMREMKNIGLQNGESLRSMVFGMVEIVKQGCLIEQNTRRGADNTDILVDQLASGFGTITRQLGTIEKNTKTYTGRG